MSFQQVTYDKARRAIDTGDVALLKSLIKRPVQATAHQRLVWLKQLVVDAAEAGLGEAVDHLLALSPDNTSTGPRVVDAWVAAQEAGQPTLAGQLFTRMPNNPDDQRTWQNPHGWFTTAVEACAWTVALTLMDDGYVPVPGQVAYALKRLREAKAHARHPATPALLRRLVPLAAPGALAWAGVVALRCNDEDTLNACLERGGRNDLIKDGAELAESAIQTGRYDLFERLTAHLKQTRTAQEMAEGTLDRALVGNHLTFVRDALAARADVRTWIREHHDTAVSLTRELLLRVEEPAGAVAEHPLLKPIFQQLCSSEQADLAKAHLEKRYNTPGARSALLHLLNTMALWVEPEVRGRWFETEPVTFAEAIAWTRSQATVANTGADGHTAARRKPRVRA